MAEQQPTPEQSAQGATAQPPKARRKGPDWSQCIARSRSTGARCKQDAVKGREVCRWHGGLAPIHGNMTGGRFSKLPSRLKAIYDRGLTDATLLDHRPILSMLNAMVEDLAQRMAEDDVPELRVRSAALVDDARGMLAAGDQSGAEKKLAAASEMLHAGMEADDASRQLFTWTERLGVRIDEAWRIRLQRQQVMAASDIVGMLTMQLQRARSKWSEEHARDLAEMFESLLADTAAAPGRGEIMLAALPPEGQTGNGGTGHGNAASGS